MASNCSKFHNNTHNRDDFCLEQSFSLRAGILLISEVAVVSFVLALSLLIYSLRRAYQKYQRYRRDRQFDNVELWLQPVSILFLCAIFLDALQAFSNILSARWAFKGEVTEGAYCTMQAALKQMGNDGVAWLTIAISVLTYLQVVHPSVLGDRGAKIFAAASICFISLFIILMVAIPASTIHPYYGNTGMWCWIIDDNSPENDRLRIGSEYGWMWLAILVSVGTYGTIVYKWLRQASFDQDRNLKRDAIAMGWYPIAYFVVVAPQSVIRFLQFQQSHRPNHGWTILTSVLFSSGGALNVILWLFTGRRFGFSPEKRPLPSESRSSGNMEMANVPDDAIVPNDGVYPYSGDAFPPSPPLNHQQSPASFPNSPQSFAWTPSPNIGHDERV